MCEKQGVSVIVGGGYNSGIRATGAVHGAKYNYARRAKACWRA
jgi:D-threo-aldose 1-dehydrogenase